MDKGWDVTETSTPSRGEEANPGFDSPPETRRYLLSERARRIQVGTCLLEGMSQILRERERFGGKHRHTSRVTD